MKMLLSLIMLSASTSAFAIYFDITGPCSEKPLAHGTFKTDLEDSVGQITIDILNSHQIPYTGDVKGINSIFSSPIGDDALEVLSDTKMRAYGWCFSVNGVVPDIMSHKLYFESQSDYLSWFYAYSTYDQGVWVDYCVPAYTIKSPQICK
jgi:hypothetical protein